MESEQVEQDLLICRALTEIYKDEYWASHLAFRGSTKEFIINLEDKMRDEEFLGDTQQLLRPDENFNPQDGYEVVRSLLIDRLQR